MSDAVCFIMKQEGHGIWNYIDDFLCVSLPSKMENTYTRLQELLAELGLTASTKNWYLPVYKSHDWVFWWIPWTSQFQLM